MSEKAQKKTFRKAWGPYAVTLVLIANFALLYVAASTSFAGFWFVGIVALANIGIIYKITNDTNYLKP